MKIIIIFFVTLFFLFKTVTINAQQNLVTLINTQRSVPLTENAQLDQSAMTKACDMAKQGYWSHYTPQGISPWAFIWNAGYHYVWAGENIAKNFSNDNSVVVAWLNSPTHRTVMLSTIYREIGVAHCGNIVVAHFGRR
jgi:uncharacterized protein YkwD